VSPPLVGPPRHKQRHWKVRTSGTSEASKPSRHGNQNIKTRKPTPTGPPQPADTKRKRTAVPPGPHYYCLKPTIPHHLHNHYTCGYSGTEIKRSPSTEYIPRSSAASLSPPAPPPLTVTCLKQVWQQQGRNQAPPRNPKPTPAKLSQKPSRKPNQTPTPRPSQDPSG
jgi:hypothetical protein